MDKETIIINQKGEAIKFSLIDSKKTIIEINGKKCEYVKNEIAIIAREINRLSEDIGW